MEDYSQDEQGFSQIMWEDFTLQMDSSSFGAMQRIAAEASRMNEEMEVENEEITNVNEVVAEAEYGNEVVAEESVYGNEVVIEPVTDETTCMNEVVIEAVADETTCGNEEVSESGTDDDSSGNEETSEAGTDDDSSGNEEASEAGTDDDSSGNEEVSEAGKDDVSSGYEANESREEFDLPEEEEPRIKMRRFLSIEKYFFIEDLIAAVKEQIRNKDEENSPKQIRHKKSLCHGDFYFSPVLERYVNEDILYQEREFLTLISESIPNDYICVFETCKERFIDRFKPTPYEKRGFVRFCVAIAYLGIYCSDTRLDPGGERKATNYICSLLYEVLQQGTLEDSSWPKSYFELE